jgi:hypothetical protein
MNALKESGLFDAAQQRCFCVNGGDVDFLTACALVPPPGNVVCHHGGESELPTLKLLRENLEPGWAVFYHHMKGVSKPGDTDCQWRQRMEQACVWRWRECVKALEQGYDTAGTQWITPFPGKTFPPGQRYWAGNFWWATSDYLMTLAPLVEPQYVNRTEWENRYEAEVWIGKSQRPPKIMSL